MTRVGRLSGARLLDGRDARIDGRLLDGRDVRLRVEDGRISSIESLDARRGRPLLLPGLVDLQVNGYAGHDINAEDVSADMVVELTRALWAHGVTSYCPTVVTGSRDRILSALRTVAQARERAPLVAGTVVGVHVEGPYLAAADGPRGAHDARHLRDPDPRELAQWLAAVPGLVRIVTLAPERPGSAAYIRAATQAGVVVAVGHTDASPQQLRGAARAGATLSTHLGNGTHAVLPRHPNHVWAQLAEDSLTATFIADGHHLPADAFTAMVRAKGPERAVLVSDSVALAGCPPGEYRTPVGGEVTVEPSGKLRLSGTQLLAGSGRSLLDCVRWAVRETPFTLAEVWAMASANPARALGLTGRGVIEVGARADLCVAQWEGGREGRLRLLATLVGGAEI
ncbi:N-acetylglucosamine-6-phosphate deacetylase [Streptomyces sp. NBC_01618]|uniref:N-acetylglucosamine-6-phosphate deacetylase n=1 Tax=Streptomyces sp. NBC_01618 TaxID=2975900 RepID=UPI0038669241|nr:amidohydrolase family protein [Streptomyces sp. NBC_01618]